MKSALSPLEPEPRYLSRQVNPPDCGVDEALLREDSVAPVQPVLVYLGGVEAVVHLVAHHVGGVAERGGPGTQTLPVWQGAAVLAHQRTGVAVQPGGAEPGEGDPVPGHGAGLQPAQLAVLPPLQPAQPDLHHVVVPLLHTEAGPASLSAPAVSGLHPDVVPARPGRGHGLQLELSEPLLVPVDHAAPLHPHLPPVPLGPVRQAVVLAPLPARLQAVQLQGLIAAVRRLQPTGAAAVVTEAEPGDSPHLPVHAAPVAGPGRLVHLDQLGVQQGDVLLPVLPQPAAQTLPLQLLVREGAAAELELQLVARLAGGGPGGGAGARLAGVSPVCEGELPLAEHGAEHLLETVSGPVVAPGLVEHHLPRLPVPDGLPVGTVGFRLLRGPVALVDRVQGVHLDDVGRPHLRQQVMSHQ